MNDRKKVIKEAEEAIDILAKAEEPTFWLDFVRCAFENALAMLKEQEPVKPTVSVDTWICSKCGHTLESQELIDDKENPKVLVHEQYEYCPCCGRKVKWDGKVD